MVMDHVKSLENKIRQESKQLVINRVKHESDLRNMSQQYEFQINKLIHEHQQQVSDFEAQIQAKHNEMLALKNQLSVFNSQPHSYTTPPPPQPHPMYQPYSSIWQNNAPKPSYINNTVVDTFNYPSFSKQKLQSSNSLIMPKPVMVPTLKILNLGWKKLIDCQI